MPAQNFNFLTNERGEGEAAGTDVTAADQQQLLLIIMTLTGWPEYDKPALLGKAFILGRFQGGAQLSITILKSERIFASIAGFEP